MVAPPKGLVRTMRDFRAQVEASKQTWHAWPFPSKDQDSANSAVYRIRHGLTLLGPGFEAQAVDGQVYVKWGRK